MTANITLVLPCYNEEQNLELAYNRYRHAGFTNILVIDDGSRDNTSEIAKRIKVKVVKNYQVRGFNAAVLRGLYEVQTEFALIMDPYREVTVESLNEFVSFGTKGQHSLLISQGKSARFANFSRVLRRRFNIFIMSPSFEAVFVGPKLLKAIKLSVSLTGRYVYFDFLIEALRLKQKVGVYPLNFNDKAYGMDSWILRWFTTLTSVRPYLNYAFPGLKRRETSRDVWVALLGAFAGAVFAALITFALTRFNVIT